MISLISQSELDEISIPFSSVDRIAGIVDEFGAAVITDVFDVEELKQLESLWGQDLSALLPHSCEIKFAVDDVVHTPFGVGRIKSIRKPDSFIVVEPLTWILANGKSPLLYLNPNDCKTSMQILLDRIEFAKERREQHIIPRLWPVNSSVGVPFVVDYGLPHGSFAWTSRLSEKIKHVYQHLYDGEDDLVTGMDVVFFNPNNSSPSEKCAYSAHADQNKNVPSVGEMKIFQSALYVWPSLTEQDATTVVWLKSHIAPYEQLMTDPTIRMHAKHNFHYNETKSMYDKTSRADLKTRFLSEARRVRMQAGSLLVWNSRTLHQVIN